ncbi:MAG: hypothetical protein R2788_02880 [Saprospiraceae bacterium]
MSNGDHYPELRKNDGGCTYPASSTATRTTRTVLENASATFEQSEKIHVGGSDDTAGRVSTGKRPASIRFCCGWPTSTWCMQKQHWARRHPFLMPARLCNISMPFRRANLLFVERHVYGYFERKEDRDLPWRASVGSTSNATSTVMQRVRFPISAGCVGNHLLPATPAQMPPTKTPLRGGLKTPPANPITINESNM